MVFCRIFLPKHDRPHQSPGIPSKPHFLAGGVRPCSKLKAKLTATRRMFSRQRLSFPKIPRSTISSTYGGYFVEVWRKLTREVNQKGNAGWRRRPGLSSEDQRTYYKHCAKTQFVRVAELHAPLHCHIKCSRSVTSNDCKRLKTQRGGVEDAPISIS